LGVATAADEDKDGKKDRAHGAPADCGTGVAIRQLVGMLHARDPPW
jgi:hypothetical protein